MFLFLNKTFNCLKAFTVLGWVLPVLAALLLWCCNTERVGIAVASEMAATAKMQSVSAFCGDSDAGVAAAAYAKSGLKYGGQDGVQVAANAEADAERQAASALRNIFELPRDEGVFEKNTSVKLNSQKIDSSCNTSVLNNTAGNKDFKYGSSKNSAAGNDDGFMALPLSYAKAEEAKKTLQGLVAGRLAADAATNSLLFCGTQAEMAKLRQAAAQLDVATRQVTLEAKLVAVSCEDAKAAGMSWLWDDIPQRGDSDDTYGGNFKFWHGYAFRFRATLNALLAQGRARVMAMPRLVTLPGREASIFIGDHIPVQTEKHDSGGTYTSTEYLDAGIKLRYTPVISRDGGMVTAAVHTEVSTPSLVSEIKNYKITSRAADTYVRMQSGETLVIGGLLGDEEQSSLQKVPVLGDLPLLGALFRSSRRQKTKTEVLMLLTPYVTEAGASPAIYRAAS